MLTVRRLLVAFAVCAAAIAVPSVARADDAQQTYVVRSGDSLYGIASKHRVPVGQLLSANDLEITSVILPGQQLLIPGEAGSAPTAAAPGLTYTVVAGDSLSRIANRHGVSLTSLLHANNLTITSLILPGRQLTLPPGATPPATPQATSPTPTAPAASTYTVVAGDSLSRIANRHGVSLTSLLHANNLTITSLILPGRQLTLPPGATPPATPQATSPTPTAPAASTYTVVAGDSLSRIANRHGVSLTSLLHANNLTITSLILPGRQLTLPPGATPPAVTTPSGSSQLQTVIDYAIAQQGKPYAFFTNGPDAFDCSGLVAAAYAQVNRTLVHYSAAQALQGTPVDFGNEPILPGDLIFMKRNGSEAINHVGMAISTTAWIQAVGPGSGVRIGPMPSNATITAVRRILPG